MLHFSIKIQIAFNGPGILVGVLLFECISVWPQNIAIAAWCITCDTRQRLLLKIATMRLFLDNWAFLTEPSACYLFYQEMQIH